MPKFKFGSGQGGKKIPMSKAQKKFIKKMQEFGVSPKAGTPIIVPPTAYEHRITEVSAPVESDKDDALKDFIKALKAFDGDLGRDLEEPWPEPEPEPEPPKQDEHLLSILHELKSEVERTKRNLKVQEGNNYKLQEENQVLKADNYDLIQQNEGLKKEVERLNRELKAREGRELDI
jgi:hypothetical protein